MAKKNGNAPAKKARKPALRSSFQSAEDFLDRMEKFPPVYFDKRNGCYWFRPKGEWLPLSTRELALHFQMRGLTKAAVPGLFGLREIDWPIFNASENNVVSYAGPLAGHKAGLTSDVVGKRWLVTEEPPLDVWGPLPKSGEPAFCIALIQELLQEEQWLYFCYWLSLAYASLRRGDFRLGQAVIFAGPAQCGKSLLQSLITLVLGGRSAKPYKYMVGEAKFNIELIKAEHWSIEDPPSSTDLKTRRAFGERLKECCNNREFEALQKQKDAEIVAIFRRLSMSVNDETEHLSVVPPLVEGTADKIFLFKCTPAVACLDRFIVTDEQLELKGTGHVGNGQLDEERLKAVFHAEVPVFRAYLLRQFSRVPAELADRRYGIKAWHHPELLAEINSLEPCERFLVFLDQVWWDEKFPTPWIAKSTDMDKQMRDLHPRETERLLFGTNAMGSHLKKLIKRYPNRVSKRVLNGHAIWTIHPPSNTQETQEEKETAE